MLDSDQRQLDALVQMAAQYPEAESGLVLYTDGGCRTSKNGGGATGEIGCGIHGYYYLKGKPKQGHGAKHKPTTKGYAVGDENIGEPITVVAYLEYVENFPERATNNVAELLALVRALQFALSTTCKSVTLYTDSEYAVKGWNEWLERWIKANWRRPDNTEVKNKKLWLMLKDAMDAVTARETTVDLIWVKGHAGNYGNTHADRLATAAVNAKFLGSLIRGWTVIEPKAQWVTTVESHPLLTESSLIYSPYAEPSEGASVYHITNSKTYDTWGMPDATQLVGVVHLKQPLPAVEALRAIQKRALEGELFQPMCYARLDHVYSSRVHQSILAGGHTLEIDATRCIVYNRADVVSQVLNPPRRSYELFENVEQLNQHYCNYLGKNGSNERYRITDISALIYEVSIVKDKPVVKHIAVGDLLDVNAAYVSVDGLAGEINIRLTFGVDIPGNRHVNNLAKLGASFKLLTWPEDSCTLRYALVVELGEDCGIWAGVYVNRRIYHIPSA